MPLDERLQARPLDLHIHHKSERDDEEPERGNREKPSLRIGAAQDLPRVKDVGRVVSEENRRRQDEESRTHRQDRQHGERQEWHEQQEEVKDERGHRKLQEPQRQSAAGRLRLHDHRQCRHRREHPWPRIRKVRRKRNVQVERQAAPRQGESEDKRRHNPLQPLVLGKESAGNQMHQTEKAHKQHERPQHDTYCDKMSRHGLCRLRERMAVLPSPTPNGLGNLNDPVDTKRSTDGQPDRQSKIRTEVQLPVRCRNPRNAGEDRRHDADEEREERRRSDDPRIDLARRLAHYRKREVGEGDDQERKADLRPDANPLRTDRKP